MFVSGVSTHKVGEVAQTLLGVAPSASAVSRLNQTLIEQYEAWRERPLLPHYCIMYAGRSSILPFVMGHKPMRR
jgi:putative transposase